LAEQAALAEQAGFDWLVLGDRHNWPGGFQEALTTLAWLAARTDRIGLATAGLILPLYSPVLVAEALANIDVLSRGRLTAGFVLGYRPEEFSAFEVAPRERVARFEEGLQIITRLWSGEKFTFRGRHHQLEEVAIGPLPVQRPRPTIWGAGRVASAIRRTASLLDGWTSSFNEEPTELQEKINIYRDAPSSPESLGRSVIVCRDGFCAGDAVEARRIFGPPAIELLRMYADWKRTSPDADHYRDLTWEALSGRVLVGGPEEFCEGVDKYSRMGADAIILRVQPPGLSHADTMRCLALLGERVLPNFNPHPISAARDAMKG
jgi:alkanesulfonate monooxygenase SsuD/methylene tetrahydromethanopterin reductase-like flavin-dependent oxidoreductase (luciferase family)